LSSSQAEVAAERPAGAPKSAPPEAAGRTQKIAATPAETKKDHAWLAFARRVPRKAWWAALLLLAAILLFSWRFSVLGETATLKLKVQHSFKSAEIAVFIDGESRYTGKLSGTAKRRFGLRNLAEGSFSHTFHLHPGNHVVRVHIKSAADGYNETNELPVEIGPDKERLLAVSADRRTASLRMAAQVTESSAIQATPSWYQSYFTSLWLTISGSMVSMLFGYLIQQFVGLFRRGKPPTATP
jgi:hypothetical protein